MTATLWTRATGRLHPFCPCARAQRGGDHAPRERRNVSCPAMLTAMQQRLRMGTCNTHKDLVHLIGVAEAESAGAARADITAALMSRDLIIGLADLAATCRNRCQSVPICILQA